MITEFTQEIAQAKPTLSNDVQFLCSMAVTTPVYSQDSLVPYRIFTEFIFSAFVSLFNDVHYLRRSYIASWVDDYK